MLSLELKKTSEDLWLAAAKTLADDQTICLDFDRPDKVDVISDLLSVVEDAKQSAIKKSWRYTRRSGEVVVLRDVLSKVAHWLQRFREIGDIVVQYDPVHAALPWAGVRFLLMISTSDFASYGSAMENTSSIIIIICRAAALEAALVQAASSESDQVLRNALVRLYATVLGYLADARAYFLQSTSKRIFKSVFSMSALEDCFARIAPAQAEVDRCLQLSAFQDHVQAYSTLKQQLSDLQAPINRWDDTLTEINDELDRSNRIKILNWLSRQPHAKHHAEAKHDVLESTGRWLLNDPQYAEWRESSASSILWLHGIPGSGKTKLVSLVIEDILSCYQQKQCPPPVYFYCSRNPGESDRSNPQKILASIARQLSSLDKGKPLLAETIEAFQDFQDESPDDEALIYRDIEKLINNLATYYPTITIVLDALDECDPGQRRHLLTTLQDLLTSSPTLVKIFVSSRDDQDIVYRLNGYPNLAISSTRNHEDIVRFVNTETQSLIKTGNLLRSSPRKEELQAMIIDAVTARADGMFRWVSLQLQALCQFHSDDAILERLAKLPPTLGDLYRELLDNIMASPSITDTQYARNTLMWLLCAESSLQVDDFLSAVSHTVTNNYPPTRDQVLGLCQNLVVFDNSLQTFRFAHLSVREFLESNPIFTKPVCHAFAAEICLSMLLENDSSDLQPVTLQNRFLAMILLPYYEHKPIEDYTDLYWGLHCREAQAERNRTTLRNLIFKLMGPNTGGGTHYQAWKHRIDMKCQRGVSNVSEEIAACDFHDCSVLYAACAFDIVEIVEHYAGTFSTLSAHNFDEGEICLQLACKFGCLDTAKVLISSGVVLTPKIMEMAMENEAHAVELIRLFEVQPEFANCLTDDVIQEAAVHDYTQEIMATILKALGGQSQSQSQIPQTLICSVMHPNGKPVEVLELLLREYADKLKITQSIVNDIVSCGKFAAKLLTMILQQPRYTFKVTELTLENAAGNEEGGLEVFQLLLQKRRSEVKLTESILSSAALNEQSGKAIIQLLASACPRSVEVTGGAFSSAATAEIAQVLLEVAGPSFIIDTDILSEAMWNNVGEVMAVLLEREDGRRSVTERLISKGIKSGQVKPVAELLKAFDTVLPTTEKLILTAAENGDDMLALVLPDLTWPSNIEVTQGLLQRAAGQPHSILFSIMVQHAGAANLGREGILIAVRNQRPSNSLIAAVVALVGESEETKEEVFIAALRNDLYNREWVGALLSKLGVRVPVTEAFLVAAVKGGVQHNRAIVRMFLLVMGDEIHITEKVLLAALDADFGDEKTVFHLLLTEAREPVAITEAMLVKAASHSTNPVEIMALLFKRCDADVIITEAVFVAAASNIDIDLLKLLFRRRGQQLQVTLRVLMAVVMNRSEGTNMFKLILAERGNDLVLPESVLRVAVTNYEHGLGILKLVLEKRGPQLIRMGIVEAAASSGRLDILDWIAGLQLPDVNISEEDRTAATFYSAAREGHLGTVQDLFNRVADVNRKNALKMSPLMAAVSLRRQTVVSFLAAKDAVDVNYADYKGNTALHYIASWRPYESTNQLMAESLVARGADFGMPNLRRETALDLALRNRLDSLVALFLAR